MGEAAWPPAPLALLGPPPLQVLMWDPRLGSSSQRAEEMLPAQPPSGRGELCIGDSVLEKKASRVSNESHAEAAEGKDRDQRQWG